MNLYSNEYLDNHFSQTNLPSGNDAILRLLRHLGEDDRLLLELACRAGLPRIQVARLLGVPSWVVTRRIQRLEKRLHDPIVRALLEAPCPLARGDRQIAIDHFLQGLSVKQLMAKHRVNAYAVHRILGYARGFCGGLRSGLVCKSSQ